MLLEIPSLSENFMGERGRVPPRIEEEGGGATWGPTLPRNTHIFYRLLFRIFPGDIKKLFWEPCCCAILRYLILAL